MSYTITNQCIACNRCQTVCPTGAIESNGTHLQINSELCHSCIGFYSVPQCAAICPTNHACVPSAADYWERWFYTYKQLIERLRHGQQTEYWERWFTHYSHSLTGMMKSHPNPSLNAHP